MMLVDQKLAGQPKHHWSVAADQGRESGFPGGVAPGDESLEKLTVRKPRNGPAIEQRLDLPDH